MVKMVVHQFMQSNHYFAIYRQRPFDLHCSFLSSLPEMGWGWVNTRVTVSVFSSRKRLNNYYYVMGTGEKSSVRRRDTVDSENENFDIVGLRNKTILSGVKRNRNLIWDGPSYAFFISLNNIVSRDVTKPTNWPVRSAKTQISLGISPV